MKKQILNERLPFMALTVIVFSVAFLFPKYVKADACSDCLSVAGGNAQYTAACATRCESHVTGPGTCPANTTKVSGVCFPTGTGLSEASVSDILKTFMSWLLGIFTVLAVMAFVVSGIQYLVSTGDEGIIETAKMNAKWSLVGIIVGLSGFLMIQAVSALLNGTNSYF